MRGSRSSAARISSMMVLSFDIRALLVLARPACAEYPRLVVSRHHAIWMIEAGRTPAAQRLTIEPLSPRSESRELRDDGSPGRGKPCRVHDRKFHPARALQRCPNRVHIGEMSMPLRAGQAGARRAPRSARPSRSRAARARNARRGRRLRCCGNRATLRRRAAGPHERLVIASARLTVAMLGIVPRSAQCRFGRAP